MDFMPAAGAVHALPAPNFAPIFSFVIRVFMRAVLRVEDILGTNYFRGLRNNPVQQIRLAFSAIVTCYAIFVGIVNLVGIGDVSVKNVAIPHIDTYFSIRNDTLSFGSDISLAVGFKINGTFEPSFDFGTFSLAIPSLEYEGTRAVSNGSFQISESGQLLIVLNFEPRNTSLPREKVKLVKKLLKKEKIGMKLSMSLGWHPKKARFIVFPNTPRHVNYSCDFLYDVSPVDKNQVIRCEHQ